MVVYELITVTCISLVVVSLFYCSFKMLYPSYLFVHVLLARFGDGLGNPRGPSSGRKWNFTPARLCRWSHRIGNLEPVKSGGENHWGETEIRRRHWMFHKKK